MHRRPALCHLAQTLATLTLRCAAAATFALMAVGGHAEEPERIVFNPQTDSRVNWVYPPACAETPLLLLELTRYPVAVIAEEPAQGAPALSAHLAQRGISPATLQSHAVELLEAMGIEAYAAGVSDDTYRQRMVETGAGFQVSIAFQVVENQGLAAYAMTWNVNQYFLLLPHLQDAAVMQATLYQTTRWLGFCPLNAVPDRYRDVMTASAAELENALIRAEGMTPMHRIRETP